MGIRFLAIRINVIQAGCLRLFSKWSESRIGCKLIEDSALRRALSSHRSGIGCNRKTEILKLSDWNPFVLREDRLSGHHIAAISKTKRIKNETMQSLGQIAYEAYAAKVDWKSPFTGQTLKEWDTLKIMNPIVIEAWECAALIVAGQPRVKVLAHVVNGNLVRYKGEPSHHA